MAIDESFKRLTPAENSWSAKTKMGQRMALVHHRLNLLDDSRHVQEDGDFKDEELAIVFGEQSKELDDYIILKRKRGRQAAGAESSKSKMEQKGIFFNSGRSSDCKSDKDDDFETSSNNDDFQTTRKRGRPTGSKSAKSKMEQKRLLFDSSSSSDCRSDKDDDFEPTTKRGRAPGSKSAKSKKPQLVDSRSRSSEGKEDKDGDLEPEVSDDDGRDKSARVKDFYGTAWDRAVKVNEKLPEEGPSFIKLMLKSHVVRGFWLGLPVSFCRNYLPDHDVTVELEDEDGHSYDTNYLARKGGLSGGWHGFVVQHDLKVGDAVVFQLVRPTRFKVYVLRENKFTTTDGALSLLNLDTSKENNISEENSSDGDVMSKEDSEGTRLGGNGTNDDSSNLAIEEAADNDGIRSPDHPDTGFNTMTSLRDFKTVIDGSAIDRKLIPAHMRTAYYELCLARKAFLHRGLLKQISPMFAAGVIMETVNIAVDIRASSASSSSLEDLAAWKKILESFEFLGMDVAFLRKRVDGLLALLTAQPDLQVAAQECEGYEKVKLERNNAAEEMRALESRMSSLKDALEEMDVEMKEMVESSARKKKDQAMRQLAAAPW
ncbi:B3 domain-containing protein Os01g0234100 isoform X1 [Lolium perenne]|uniref:B3 domain-containing protein Os01g0234100 isoform X1 n=1 Tax=Lolium perenne TaxID=4522 RepID=UPI003A9A3160